MRAHLAVLLEGIAQPIEAFHDGFPGEPARGFAPVSTLMPGMTRCCASTSASGVPVELCRVVLITVTFYFFSCLRTSCAFW